MDTIKFEEYTGPLILFCQQCNEERMTRIRWNTSEVKVNGDGGFDISMTGNRQCFICASFDVVLRWISMTLTIDTQAGEVT